MEPTSSQIKALKALGINFDKISDVEVGQAIAACGINGIGRTLEGIAKKKRDRIQRLFLQDGAVEYQPLTKAYAQKGYLGPKTLKKLRQAKRGY